MMENSEDKCNPLERSQQDHDSQVPGWTGKPTEAEIAEAFTEFKVNEETFYRCKGCKLTPFKSADFRIYHYILCKDLDDSYKCDMCRKKYLVKCFVESHEKHRQKCGDEKNDSSNCEKVSGCENAGTQIKGQLTK